MVRTTEEIKQENDLFERETKYLAGLKSYNHEHVAWSAEFTLDAKIQLRIAYIILNR